MSYFCGWDGGGTKTAVLCTDQQGKTLAEGVFGPLNTNGNTAERVMQSVHDAVVFMQTVAGGLEDCAGLVVGVAGVSNAETVKLLRDRLQAVGYHGPLRIMGDQEIALAGAISGPGAVLIAGTGSVCCGRDVDGNSCRTGGYGYLIDDCGSGYAVGRDILMAVVRAHDGRGPKTCLTQMVFDTLQIHEIRGLITWLYAAETGKKEIAALSRLLLEALDQGDEAAKLIASRAAHDLCDMVTALWAQAGLVDGELVLDGSILKHYQVIKEELTMLLKQALPGLTIVQPWGTPAQGAVLLARQMTEE